MAQHPPIHPHILSAIRTLDLAAAAIGQLKSFLTEDFIHVVDLFCQTKGRVVVTGIGKSGHIARKIAATLSSTGTPAFFLHPAEASHGDLGMLTKDDVFFALSNSGEVEEIATILPHVRRMGIPIIALTGNKQSTLARYANHTLCSYVEAEACPHNLAPTTSTSAQLAMGDAIAIACLEFRGFQVADFAASHPGGTLGRKLLTKVADIMRTGQQIPIVCGDTAFLTMLEVMSQSGLGLAITVDQNGVPSGVFTDGDLRRLLSLGQESLLTRSAASLMHKYPKTIEQSAMAVDAAAIMEEEKITSVLVVDDHQTLVGVLNTNDLLRAKVI